MENEKLLEELTQAFGVAGFEGEVREIIRREAAPYADQITQDAIGNLIVLKKGRENPHKKKIMFAAHMDEIGFMVKKILDDGTLLVCNMGWNWAGSAYNERVRFRSGVTGVVGCRGPIEEALRGHWGKEQGRRQKVCAPGRSLRIYGALSPYAE